MQTCSTNKCPRFSVGIQNLVSRPIDSLGN